MNRPTKSFFKKKASSFTENSQAGVQTKHIFAAPCAAFENDLLLNIRWSIENVNTPRFCFPHWHVMLGAKVSIQDGMTAMRHQAGLNLTWQDMLEAANKWQIIKARSSNMHLLLSGMYIPPGPGKGPCPKKRITFQRKEVKANSSRVFFFFYMELNMEDMLKSSAFWRLLCCGRQQSAPHETKEEE